MSSATNEYTEQLADILTPEAGLIADADPVLFGRALARALGGAMTNPAGASRATLSFLATLTDAGRATANLMLGRAVDGPVPSDDDRRFSDPTWQRNPAFFALHQVYGAGAGYLRDLLDEARLDDASRAKADFALNYLLDAIAPTNGLLTNPEALKRAFETGGMSVIKGLRNMLDDVVNNDGRPRQVDTSPFTLGENLAATPGKVVFRNELMELIQYEAQTDEVHEIPILCSPPWINKYYIMDLAPGKSLIEWAVQHGHTVFMISYRNPDASMRKTTMDDYLIHGPHTAMDVVAEITGQDTVNIIGLCLGGALTAMLVAYLKAVGEDRVNSITLLNTLLDYREPGELGVFTDMGTIERLEAKMEKTGYLPASEMRGTFDALRPNDLIFNYVVNNWLKGEDPPPFDILTWNADSTNMPAEMHSWYLRSCYINNELAENEMELAGQHLSLKDVDCDAYIVAAQNDHIAPWRSSYSSTQLLGGNVRFCLSSRGHIAGIVNPPSPKAKIWLSSTTPPDPYAWWEIAEESGRSWWEDWSEWIAERAGEQVDARLVGSDAHPPVDDAPGRYVRASAD
ncbi:MAG: alpha/beta fold hydrolase [Actinobacteria bacterium]|nr:alpha/beta fold hydrolase [Actinomycetota bacterium]